MDIWKVYATAPAPKKSDEADPSNGLFVVAPLAKRITTFSSIMRAEAEGNIDGKEP